MKERLKHLVGPQWQRRLHRLSRLRWLNKARIVRDFDRGQRLWTRAAYVLWDPETESFSYELADEEQMLAGLAAALGAELEQLEGYAREVRADPELHERLSRHLRWRFDVKHRPALGHRLAWYVIARALKPKVVVETGIYDGLGSLALLRALERNAEEGAPGELLSFDLNPHSGSVVREGLRGRWRRVHGFTGEVLGSALDSRRVGLMIQDTPHTEENQRFEFGQALSRAEETLVLIDGSGGWARTLSAICSERGGAYHLVPAPSRRHIAPGTNVSMGVFREAGARADAA